MRVQRCSVAALLLSLTLVIACGGGSRRSSGATTEPPPKTSTLVSIQVSPSSVSLTSGSTKQFTATGTYNDGTTKDITTSVTWSSSAVATATVSAAGVVTAVGPGQATISASSGSATAGSGAVTVQPSALSITAPNATLGLGQAQQLTALATYTSGQQDVTSSVSWNSADASIVSVSTSGVATGVAMGGPVSITATLGSLSASTGISVGGPVLTQIMVSPISSYDSYCGAGGPPMSCSIATHQVLQFQAKGVYSDGHNVDVTDSATWLVDGGHTSNVHFLSAGLAFGDSATTGSATVTASFEGISGTADLTVTSAMVTTAGVIVTPAAWSLPILATKQFTATAVWSDGSAQDITNNPVATWASDNSEVAIVGPNSTNDRLAKGTAQGLTVGSAGISVTMDGQSGSATLTVTPARLASVTVTPNTSSIPMVLVQQFTAIGTFTDLTSDPPQTTQVDITDAVTWTAADSTIASVSSGGAHPGLAVPLHVGETTITATLPGAPAIVSAPVTLKVTGAQLTEIVVTPASPKLGLGAALQFTATAKFDDASTYDLTNYYTWSGLNPWSSSRSTVASISNAGYVSTSGLGTTTISATVSGVTGTTELTVTPAQLRAVVILPSTQNPGSLSFDAESGLPVQPILGMTPHTRIQLKAYGYYTDQTFQALSGVIWSTPPPRNIAVVTGSGVVLAKTNSSGGTVSVKASVAGSSITGNASLVVAGAIDKTLLLLWKGSPNPAQIAAGTGLQFSAWATSSGTPVQDVTTFVQWSTDNPACAMVSSTGFALGFAGPCTAHIRATYNNQSTVATSSVILTVTNAKLSSIAIAPANPALPNPPIIPLGASQQLTATGTFSDGSTQDLTNQVLWSSSDIAVVVMSTSTRGLAVSSGAGTATIGATQGSNTPGTTTVTVTTPAASQVK